jgi:guanylate kinase
MQDTKTKGKLVIISGPSGVGKSTIVKMVAEKLGAFVSVSATTRAIGQSEQNGREYWFVTREEFEARIQNDDFLEYADVFGNYYGTPRGPIDQALGEGRTVILEIDVQGAMQVKKLRRDAMTIFILPPKKEDLLTRIDHRKRGEDEQSKRRRLETAASEIAAAWQRYDHMVVNDQLDVAVQEVIELINDSEKE